MTVLVLGVALLAVAVAAIVLMIFAFDIPVLRSLLGEEPPNDPS